MSGASAELPWNVKPYGSPDITACDVIDAAGSPMNGMVMDFSEVKTLARQHLVDAWDHAFLAWREDRAVTAFLASMPEHKTVVLDVVPTAENLAQIAFTILDAAYRDVYGNRLRLERVRLFETPNCWADALRRSDRKSVV